MADRGYAEPQPNYPAVRRLDSDPVHHEYSLPAIEESVTDFVIAVGLGQHPSPSTSGGDQGAYQLEEETILGSRYSTLN